MQQRPRDGPMTPRSDTESRTQIRPSLHHSLTRDTLAIQYLTPGPPNCGEEVNCLPSELQRTVLCGGPTLLLGLQLHLPQALRRLPKKVNLKKSQSLAQNYGSHPEECATAHGRSSDRNRIFILGSPNILSMFPRGFNLLQPMCAPGLRFVGSVPSHV
ncbi:hypothetical protein EDB85DRAFT_1576344 [Lactarius pseudohatsudake]|nr:hypothetical protein EDB85DRAFT_1576344 [Lactarius pseudohatsudake]